MTMHGGMPIEAAEEHGRQLSRRGQVFIGRQNMQDVVGIFAVYAIQGETGEAVGGLGGKAKIVHESETRFGEGSRKAP